MEMGRREEGSKGIGGNKEAAWFVYEELSKVITDHAFTYRKAKRNDFNLKVLNTRIEYLMATWQELGLKQPFPSAPSKWGKYCLWIEHKGKLMILTYTEAYYSRLVLDALIQKSTVSWITPKEILTSNGLVIKSDYLEELLELELSKKEKECELSEPDKSNCAAFLRGEKVNITPPTDRVPPKAKREEESERKKEPQVKKDRAPRPDGLIALQDICAELKIEPKDARAVLRSKKVEKPAHGRWEWPQTEVASIKKIIAGAGKK